MAQIVHIKEADANHIALEFHLQRSSRRTREVLAHPVVNLEGAHE